MSEKKEAYFFDSFRLELCEKMLFHEGKTVALTPKMFETLLVLVENSGKVVEKEDLMQKIWHDRFVEENNLTFNIKMLRKSLGDDAKNPKFIETIPRRGYRFIADVSDYLADSAQDISNGSSSNSNYVFGRNRLIAVALLIVAISSIVYATLIWQQNQMLVPLLANEFNLVKLTNSGSVAVSAISPNGKIVAYTNDENKKQSVWLREIETGKNTNIVSTSANFVFYSLKFSKDGNDLYFTAKNQSEPLSIYKVSLAGGNPLKLINYTEGHFSISPDSSKIAFIRYNKGIRQNKIFIADIDGKNEKEIRESEIRTAYWTLDFSPDGKKLAASYGHTDSGSQEISLVTIDLETNEQKLITPQKFFNIKSIAWLKDRNKILISASSKISDPFRIWQVDFRNGDLLPLTFDSQSYTQITLSQENDKLSSATVSNDFYLFSSDNENSENQQKLTNSSSGFAYTSDGKIVYSTDSNAGSNIWIMNSDGTNQRQLTTDSNLNGYPIISADNEFIYFTSNRTGEMHVWRMKADGSGQTQITKENGGFPAFISPDGKILYYQKSHTGGIWQIPTAGGEESEVIPEKNLVFLTFSPDGKFVALVQKEKNGGYRIDLMDLEKKIVVKSFQTPDKNSLPSNLNWIPNTNSFSYVLDQDFENDSLWVQDVETEKPTLYQNLGNEEISDCKFSPNGKNFAFIRGNWKHDAVLLTGLK